MRHAHEANATAYRGPFAEAVLWNQLAKFAFRSMVHMASFSADRHARSARRGAAPPRSRLVKPAPFAESHLWNGQPDPVAKSTEYGHVDANGLARTLLMTATKCSAVLIASRASAAVIIAAVSVS